MDGVVATNRTNIFSLFCIVATMLSGGYGAFAQKVVTHSVCSAMSLYRVDARVLYSGDNPYDTLYCFSARDNRYQSVIYMSLGCERGDSLKFFLKECIAFCEKERVGTSMSIRGITVNVSSIMGAKYLDVFDKDKHSTGYTTLTPPQMKRIIEKFDNWKNPNAKVAEKKTSSFQGKR
jgi:hypothetical protein